ncbi:hypothetical protein SDC9_189392 [bioreactor metagenome]|uniref:Uncharacterized protein n=1 Tax=bioreactor metagenome TaxID=1076179 RepID=A0A645HSC4_9ZZZZ
MKGTNAPQTLAMPFTPKSITKAVSRAITIPVIYFETEYVSLISIEIEFA